MLCLNRAVEVERSSEDLRGRRGGPGVGPGRSEDGAPQPFPERLRRISPRTVSALNSCFFTSVTSSDFVFETALLSALVIIVSHGLKAFSGI